MDNSVPACKLEDNLICG